MEPRSTGSTGSTASIRTMISTRAELSAFMDGEKHLLPYVNRLASPSRQMGRTWGEYHLIRAALKGELPDIVMLDLWHQVQRTIRQSGLPEMTDAEWLELAKVPKVSVLRSGLFWFCLLGAALVTAVWILS